VLIQFFLNSHLNKPLVVVTVAEYLRIFKYFCFPVLNITNCRQCFSTCLDLQHALSKPSYIKLRDNLTLSFNVNQYGDELKNLICLQNLVAKRRRFNYQIAFLSRRVFAQQV
jgi:hypothetical protein